MKKIVVAADFKSAAIEHRDFKSAKMAMLHVWTLTCLFIQQAFTRLCLYATMCYVTVKCLLFNSVKV